MAYLPQFTITPRLLSEVEQIADLRARILSAAVDMPWIPAMQKDARSRNVHASTAIEKRAGGTCCAALFDATAKMTETLLVYAIYFRLYVRPT